MSIDLKIQLAALLAFLWCRLIMSATDYQLLVVIPFLQGAIPTQFIRAWW